MNCFKLSCKSDHQQFNREFLPDPHESSCRIHTKNPRSVAVAYLRKTTCFATMNLLPFLLWLQQLLTENGRRFKALHLDNQMLHPHLISQNHHQQSWPVFPYHVDVRCCCLPPCCWMIPWRLTIARIMIKSTTVTTLSHLSWNIFDLSKVISLPN